MPVALRATYRLQFHAGFRLADALRLVDYLDRLGISHIYSSPLLRTRAGSLHGYDVVDPLAINPELGSEEDLAALSDALHTRGMGLLLDIVPNHMAIGSENRYWMDLLEGGACSVYAPFFDLHGGCQRGEERLVLPTLGAPPGELITGDAFRFDWLPDGFRLCHGDLILPLAARSYGALLDRLAAHWPGSGPQEFPVKIAGWKERLAAIAAHCNGPLPEALSADFRAIKRELAAAAGFDEQGTAPDPITRAIGHLSADGSLMHEILDQQHYELVDATTGLERINYRRFFDVNELGGVRVEVPAVFDATHALILEWVGRGYLDGLRIDHIDGLADPNAYLQRLESACRARLPDARPFPIFVEKIVTGIEWPPEAWPIVGMTGYETIHALRGTQVEAAGLRTLIGHYFAFTGRSEGFHTVLRNQKRRALTQLFGAETRALSIGLVQLARAEARMIDECEASLAIQGMTTHLPRYRTYIDAQGVHPVDRRVILRAYEGAREHMQESTRAALDYLRRVVLLDTSIDELHTAYLAFVTRWQQYSGPAMAKGVEDTTFYIHVPLLSLNEVGSGPETEGLELAAFHNHHQEKLVRCPAGLCALSTHDTKRSEDARARLNVLAEIPDRWAACVARWSALNRRHKLVLEGGKEIPPPNEEWIIYQSLVGVWPLEGAIHDLPPRMLTFLQKAAREGKIHSTWYNVNPAYEEALLRYMQRLLDDATAGEFLTDLRAFVQELQFHGMLNSLAQVLVKNTIPGVPDHYQGQELWDFSLVDPDNRRPVDWSLREQLLTPDALQRWRDDPRALLEHWRDGRVKMLVTAQALASRRAAPEVYATGDYLPLAAEGARARNVLAYVRRTNAAWELVAVPRLTSELAPAGIFPLGEAIWQDTRVLLPQGAPAAWQRRFSAHPLMASESGLRVADLFRDFPVALAGGTAAN